MFWKYVILDPQIQYPFCILLVELVWVSASNPLPMFSLSRSAQANAKASCFHTRVCPQACTASKASSVSLAVLCEFTSKWLAKARANRAKVWAQKACSSSPSQLVDGPTRSFSVQTCQAVSPVFWKSDSHAPEYSSSPAWNMVTRLGTKAVTIFTVGIEHLSYAAMQYYS